MIDVFEHTAQARPDAVFFTFVNAKGEETAYTYRDTRIMAAQLARRLRDKGTYPGDAVAVDLPNSPLYVFLALAAAYGGFSLVMLNHRLTASEKLTRLLELKRCGVRVAQQIDEANQQRLFNQVTSSLRRGDGRMAPIDESLGGFVEDAIHFAERAGHTFDAGHRALVMFTSGTTGKPKAAELTWANLMEASQASNRVLTGRIHGRGQWQAVLPFFHIGGFQVLVRSVCSRWPLRIYERFDARRVLADAVTYPVTHISVVDKMLQDMLNTNAKALAQYDCILLGGGPLNAKSVQRALGVKAHLYASYGMTETSSQVANSPITAQFTGGLRLLPGYTARIAEPDEEGFGSLALRGPGVFDGYVNARAPFTVDGFFLTGDTAALHNGCLYIKERTSDMFVSGGENIYPAEIVDALVRIPGVTDAYVFGMPDAQWGRRPAAVVEVVPSIPPLNEATIQAELAKRLSKLYVPKHLCLVNELPRIGIGKIDRVACENMFSQKIDVRRVVLHHIRVPFAKPFKTPKEVLTYRDSVIVEVIDRKGRVGLGECTSFDTDWYLPEVLDDDIRVMREELAPRLVAGTFLHPRDVSADFASTGLTEQYPMACSALEMACWDLYGKITEQPLWHLLGDEFDRLTLVAKAEDENAPLEAAMPPHGERPIRRRVYSGAVVGLGTPAQTVAEVRECVNAGYQRIKLKVAPGKGLPAVRAVRRAFPDVLVTLDANQSFSLHHMAELRAYDQLNVGWIEEPLNLEAAGITDAEAAFSRLASFQHTLAMPICVDESFFTASEADLLFSYPELRCAMVKIGKFGGVQPALEFVHKALSAGREVCMSGMYDTGISRFVHAAFQTLPGVVIPGDLGATSRYFDACLTEPPYEAPQGIITLNGPGHERGIGCTLNAEALADARLHRYVVE